MTCSRAWFPAGASSPAPFLLAGPAFVRVATEGTPHAVRTFRLPRHCIKHAHALEHFIGMDPERMQKWNTAPKTTSLRRLSSSTPRWSPGDFGGGPKMETTGDHLHPFRRLKFEPAVWWHDSIGEHS